MAVLRIQVSFSGYQVFCVIQGMTKNIVLIMKNENKMTKSQNKHTNHLGISMCAHLISLKCYLKVKFIIYIHMQVRSVGKVIPQ